MKTIPSIIVACAAVIGVEPSELKLKRQSKAIAAARLAGQFIAREQGHGLREIAEAFDAKSHTSVLYAIKQVKLGEDPLLREILMKAQKELRI